MKIRGIVDIKCPQCGHEFDLSPRAIGPKNKALSSKELRAKYSEYGTKSQCFFCITPATHNHRVPSLAEVRDKDIKSDEMRHYHVCTKCLNICQSHKELSHEELIKYVKSRKARGPIPWTTNKEQGAEIILEEDV